MRFVALNGILRVAAWLVEGRDSRGAQRGMRGEAGLARGGEVRRNRLAPLRQQWASPRQQGAALCTSRDSTLLSHCFSLTLALLFPHLASVLTSCALLAADYPYGMPLTVTLGAWAACLPAASRVS